MSVELGTVTERFALVLEAQKTWGERAARELAEQLDVKFPDIAEPDTGGAGGIKKSYPSHTADRFMIRMPDGLRPWIAGEAARNNRSANSQIVWMLQQMMERIEAERRSKAA